MPDGCIGDKVTGTVYSTDQRGAYVDIGAKGAAFVPSDELSLSKVERVRFYFLVSHNLIVARLLFLSFCCAG